MTLCLNITTNSQKSLQQNIEQFIVDTNWYVNNKTNTELIDSTAFVDRWELLYDNIDI